MRAHALCSGLLARLSCMSGSTVTLHDLVNCFSPQASCADVTFSMSELQFLSFCLGFWLQQIAFVWRSLTFGMTRVKDVRQSL